MSNFHLVFFENYEYNGYVPQLYRVAARKSWAPVGEGKYQHFQILGRVSRPRQGDTVSPRRGLNDTGDILDIRKDVAADSQHKTAFRKRSAG